MPVVDARVKPVALPRAASRSLPAEEEWSGRGGCGWDSSATDARQGVRGGWVAGRGIERLGGWEGSGLDRGLRVWMEKEEGESETGGRGKKECGETHV